MIYNTAVRHTYNNVTGLYISITSVLRILILLCMMMMAGSACADEEREITGLSFPIYAWDTQQISGTNFTSDDVGSVIRVKVDSDNTIYFVCMTDWGAIWDNKTDFQGSPYYNSSTNSFDFEITKDNIEKIKLGLYIQSKGPTIEKISIVKIVADEFAGSLPDGTDPVTQDIPLGNNMESYIFDFSSVLVDHPGVNYARFYIPSDANSATGIKVTGGKTFEDHPERGVYIYSDGAFNAAALKGTLEVPAMELYGKKLVAVFAENVEVTDGVPTKENELSAMYEYTFVPTTIVVHRYIRSDQSSAVFDISSLPTLLNSDLSTIKSKFTIEWSIQDASEEVQEWNTNLLFQAENTWNSWPYTLSNDKYYINENTDYYNNNTELENAWTDYNVSTPKLVCNNSTTFKDYFENNILVCKATTPVGIVKYIFHFNEDGEEPDDFVYKYKGTVSKREQEVADAAAPVTVNCSKFAGSTQYRYVRYYLTDATGSASDVSSTAVVVASAGGKHTGTSKHGTYVYNADGLTADDLSVTVTLDGVSIFDYKLVAVFSNSESVETDAEGNVTKEPEIMAKCEYTFVPKADVTHVYGYDWAVGCTTLDATGIKDKFPLDEIVETYNIKWYVQDKKGEKQPLDAYTNFMDVTWQFANDAYSIPNRPYNTEAVLKSDVQLKDKWNDIMKPKVCCPSANSGGTMKDYGDCTVGCEVRTASRFVKYIFHFTKDGESTDPFDGAMADDASVEYRKQVVNNDMVETEIDFTAEAAGMKYARFYLIDDGKPYTGNAEAIDFKDKTQFKQTERGYYLYNPEGLTADELRVKVKLPAMAFYKYHLIAVFSDREQQTDEETGELTKETILTAKYDYTFVPPTKVIHKFIKWDGEQYACDVSDMPYQLGTTLSEMKNKHTITWSVQDANGVRQRYVWNSMLKFTASGNSGNTAWPFMLLDNSAYILTEYTDYKTNYDNGDLETKWTTYNLNAPIVSTSTGRLEYYFNSRPDHTIVCEASTETSSVKYIFHFNVRGVEDDPFEGDLSKADYVQKTKSVKVTAVTTAIDFLGEYAGARYARFYIIDKDSALYYGEAMPISVKGGTVAGTPKSGMYVYNADGTPLTAEQLKVTLTLPAGKFFDYKLVAVFSDEDPVMDSEGNVIRDGSMKRKVEYSFIEEFIFVHSRGASGRDYITGDNSAAQQYSWESDCTELRGKVVVADRDIRQGTHTRRYDMYVDPDAKDKLYPMYTSFQAYTGIGNNLEPSAYIRWYDWDTDYAHPKLEKTGSRIIELKETTDDGKEVNRGLFMLNKTQNVNLTSEIAGVTFNAEGFGKDDVVTIACDASKYFDGISGDGDDLELIHEPTIGTRYIYTIRHASVIADMIAEGKKLYDTEKTLQKFHLAEDNGRYCVAMKDENTQFSVRSKSTTLSNYYFYTDNSRQSMVNGSQLGWEVYLEDATGLWKKDLNIGASGERIQTIAVKSLNGTYTLLSDNSKTQEVTAGTGMRFHLVGVLENSDATVKAPVIHYEINLLYAPAYHSGDIPLERTGAYLKAYMTLQAELPFDRFFKDENGKLSKEQPMQTDNHTYEPLEWSEAEYAFAYPKLAQYHTSSGFMGLSPIHGDYIILKTMNHQGISESGNNITADTPYKYHWWNESQLEDYTYRFGGNHEYGGFLYVDASDESRTIAKLKFETDLCKGADLCYTAVVADMTSEYIKPRLRIGLYAIYADGTKKHVVSFLSGDVSEIAANDFTSGKWYQVYGRIALPSNVDLDNVVSYEVDVDNYCTSTSGADYCIDQIMFFTNNAKMKVKQEPVSCGESEVHVNAYISADAVADYAGGKLYWRVCDEDYNPVPNRNGMYGEDGSLTYGTVVVPTAVDPESLTDIDSFKEPNGYFLDESGELSFSLTNGRLDLDEGRKYYISVFLPGGTPTSDDDPGWGYPGDICSIYSPEFVLRKMYLSLFDGTGKAQTTLEAGCGEGDSEVPVRLRAEVNIPDNSEVSGFKPYSNVRFDFFIGSLDEFENYSMDVEGGGKVFLKEALEYYRGRNITDKEKYNEWKYKDQKELDEAFREGNEAYYEVIKDAVDRQKLVLTCDTLLDMMFTVSRESLTLPLSALPIEPYVERMGSDGQPIEGKEEEICSPLEFTFSIDAEGGMPVLTLGFSDVKNYPEEVRVVRIGREQLNNMQKADGCLLRIPVNTFRTSSTADRNTGALEVIGKLDMVHEGTTDPKVTEDIDGVATFEETEVSAGKMYLLLNFHGTDVRKPLFHEGFAYKMFFVIKKKDAQANDCEGSVQFMMKVVPEFVTWNGNAGNDSWNNDGNWSRSQCLELYKSVGQNTPTAAQGDGSAPGEYKDNGDIDVELGQPDTYVPMKFTYVTLPTHNRAPKLNALTAGTTGIYSNMEDGATTNIQYDIMVRVEAENNTYGCEKFYANTCKEIYFKPEAELLNQQFLTYTKAWVEKELTANRWYLMASPLKETYAGDMYVPVSSGRQETEAFLPITFDVKDGYSRTRYPIYQRSWGMDASVYTKTSDIRADSYNAALPWLSVVEETMAQWSHTYNDVTVPYSDLGGFSIRTHRKDQNGHKTLIRLPKADTAYSYYDWADGMEDAPSGAVAKGDGMGRFVTAADGTVELTVNGVQQQHGYVLVGNPYVASVDMEKFFLVNADAVDRGYWTYEDGIATAHTAAGTVRPMQAFFVKMKDGAENLVFKPDMMVDGNHGAADGYALSAIPSLRMTAGSAEGHSAATVMIDAEAAEGYVAGEDVATLFDSNLSGVPMVYTVAGRQAVSVNALPEMDVIPFGVSADDDGMVTVTVSSTIDAPLYIYDAVRGMTAALPPGDGTLTVQSNDYGRYYITTRSVMSLDGTAWSGIVVSVRHGMVTVTAPEGLDNVTVTAPGGIQAASYTSGGSKAEFRLQPGTYVIDAHSGEDSKTMKVVVR